MFGSQSAKPFQPFSLSSSGTNIFASVNWASQPPSAYDASGMPAPAAKEVSSFFCVSVTFGRRSHLTPIPFDCPSNRLNWSWYSLAQLASSAQYQYSTVYLTAPDGAPETGGVLATAAGDAPAAVVVAPAGVVGAAGPAGALVAAAAGAVVAGALGLGAAVGLAGVVVGWGAAPPHAAAMTATAPPPSRLSTDRRDSGAD